MLTEPPNENLRLREVVIAELHRIKLALRDAGDIEASEIVEAAITELQTSPPQGPKKTFLRVTRSRLMEAATSVGATVQSATDTAAIAVRDSANRVVNEGVSVRAASDKASALIRSGASGAAAGFTAAHDALTGYAQSLEWSMIPAEYVKKFVTAGTRGIDRSLEEARLVWETVPEQLRAMGPEELAEHLKGFDWSHIVPYSKGGGNEASNGIFELAGLNRARGAKVMTEEELQAAQDVLTNKAFEAVLEEVASQMLTGGMVSAAISCVLSCLELGLQYQRGEITKDEMYRGLGRAVAKSAGVGAAISGLIAVVSLAFPPLIPLAAPVMAPLAVLGFCAVGGKVVRLGKGWYEVYRDVSTRLPDTHPATRLLTAQSPASE